MTRMKGGGRGRVGRAMGLIAAGCLVVAAGCTKSATGERALAAPAGPLIEASPWTPWVGVSNFVPGETVQLQVDLTNDGNVDFTGSQVANEFGNVQFNVGSSPVRYGSLLTAHSSTYDKSLTIPEIRVEYVNSVTNVVSGVGPASSFIVLMVQQAGPPLATAVVSTDSTGHWTHDFSGTYDIESGRSVMAQWIDADGDRADSSWTAVVPGISAGYSQYGANSLGVRMFSPGTQVRVRVDYANNGGPLDGWDYDHTSTVDSPYGFGFDLGGFDLLHPGDEIVATGGGWTKTLVTVPLRIEKADALADLVGGVASASDPVTVAVLSTGGGGPPVSTLAVTALGDGTWTADFSAIYDIATDQQVSATIVDADGDETLTTWHAVRPYFAAGVTDGPPSQVTLWNFAPGTQVRVRVDYGNNGSVDFDSTRAIGVMFGDTFDLGGSGLLHAGDLVTVTGGDWTKSGVLAPLSITAANPETDVVAGTGPPSGQVRVDLSPPPGSPGGPPVAGATVSVDSSGQWSHDFTGGYDMVLNQQVIASVADGDGDVTQAVAWAATTIWPKTGFELPIKNPPALNLQKAGSTVPIKFSLDGDRGMEIFVADYPKSSVIECASNPETAGDESILTSGRTLMTYNPVSGLYEVKWRTFKSWRGTCRQLVILFSDGTYLRANFKFT